MIKSYKVSNLYIFITEDILISSIVNTHLSSVFGFTVRVD